MTIAIKRVYDLHEASDGFRVLVDRLRPRGLTKEKAALDLWAKDIAPSTELREEFNHRPEKFAEFKNITAWSCRRIPRWPRFARK
jgi:uncharacterized protein YeaO (DUF488 family)